MVEEWGQLELNGNAVEHFDDSMVDLVSICLVVGQDKGIHTDYLVATEPLHVCM